MLDKSKPYGGIVGFFHGAKYEQNGRFYDADGIEIVLGDEPEEPSQEEPFDVQEATKDELINYAYNRYNRKLDARRSLENLRTVVSNLME
jgi:hypothetical protein